MPPAWCLYSQTAHKLYFLQGLKVGLDSRAGLKKVLLRLDLLPVSVCVVD